MQRKGNFKSRISDACFPLGEITQRNILAKYERDRDESTAQNIHCKRHLSGRDSGAAPNRGAREVWGGSKGQPSSAGLLAGGAGGLAGRHRGMGTAGELAAPQTPGFSRRSD